MLKMYWDSFKRVSFILLIVPRWMLVIISISLMSLAYSNGSITHLPIAVVDFDHTPASRDLVRALSMSSKVSIVNYDNDFDAYQAINERKIFTVVTIPRNYEKRLQKGESVAISAYGDASSRLANGLIQQDLKTIYQQVLTDYNANILHKAGFTEAQISIVLSPIKAKIDPLFNAGIGLTAITFPGLLAMLFQHSLLIASTRTQIVLASLPQGRPPNIVFLGSLSALLPIWLFLAIVFFGLWPWILGYRQLASLCEILLMSIPFIFAVLGLGKLLTECLRRIEMIYLTLAFVTTPVFYLSGTIWPLDAMPNWVQFLSKLLPSTWAVNMISGVNQMGLSIIEQSFNIFMLLVLGLFYYAIGALISAIRDGRIRKFNHYIYRLKRKKAYK